MPDIPGWLLAADPSAQATPPVLARARAYAAEGRVRSLEISGAAMTATVLGTEPYAVRVRHGDPRPLPFCDCPAAGLAAGGWCKHAVAAVLVAQQTATRHSAPAAIAVSARTAEELLADAPAETLRAILSDLAATDPVLAAAAVLGTASLAVPAHVDAVAALLPLIGSTAAVVVDPDALRWAVRSRPRSWHPAERPATVPALTSRLSDLLRNQLVELLRRALHGSPAEQAGAQRLLPAAVRHQLLPDEVTDELLTVEAGQFVAAQRWRSTAGDAAAGRVLAERYRIGALPEDLVDQYTPGLGPAGLVAFADALRPETDSAHRWLVSTALGLEGDVSDPADLFDTAAARSTNDPEADTDARVALLTRQATMLAEDVAAGRALEFSVPQLRALLRRPSAHVEEVLSRLPEPDAGPATEVLRRELQAAAGCG